ncbi:MAG: hypothetical protein WCQ67_02000 [Treponema sp.]
MMKIKLLRRTLIFILASIFLVTSCSKKSAFDDIKELDSTKENHTWYYFTENSFKEIDLPQNAPKALEKPWTESIRISSMASVPDSSNSYEYNAFAVVNRLGILAISSDTATLFSDASIFPSDTADSLVFSNGTPVFYLFRSTFFNEGILSGSNSLLENYSVEKNSSVSLSRPFLVEFNPQSKISYPLVSYSNLKLSDNDQITGYFWNGKTWACSAKKIKEDKVEFSYFSWEPLAPLTELSPALNKDVFVFSSLTEDGYRKLNTPLLFEEAPVELKDLLTSIPKDFSFYITYRDNSGTSPISYYNEGTESITPLNANAQIAKRSGYIAALFEDGTTYLENTTTFTRTAFRLPKLPVGFSYGEFSIAGNYLYASWEENNFYKTIRSGFIKIDLDKVLSKQN